MTIFYSVIFVGLVSPASARVEDDIGPVDGNHLDKTCSEGGYQSKNIVNNDCTQVTYKGLTCYANCKCDTSKYPYLVKERGSLKFKPNVDNGGEYFQLTADATTCLDAVSGNTYASDIECLTSTSTSVSLQLHPFDLSKAKKSYTSGGKTKTCYSIADVQCKSGFVQLTDSDISAIAEHNDNKSVFMNVMFRGDPVKYKAAFNWGYGRAFDDYKSRSDLVGCVTEAVGLTGYVYNSAGGKVNLTSAVTPTQPTSECAVYMTKTAQFFPGYTYYYHNGNCKGSLETGGKCLSTPQPCTNYTNERGYAYDPVNIERINYVCGVNAGYITGDRDSQGNYCLSPTTYNSPENQLVGFNYTTVGYEQPEVISVSGCAVGYEKYFDGYNDDDPAAMAASLSMAEAGGEYTAYGIKTDDYDWDREDIDCSSGGSCFDYMICRIQKNGGTTCPNDVQKDKNGACNQCPDGLVLNDEGDDCVSCSDYSAVSQITKGEMCYYYRPEHDLECYNNCFSCSVGQVYNGSSCTTKADLSSNTDLVVVSISDDGLNYNLADLSSKKRYTWRNDISDLLEEIQNHCTGSGVDLPTIAEYEALADEDSDALFTGESNSECYLASDGIIANRREKISRAGLAGIPEDLLGTDIGNTCLDDLGNGVHELNIGVVCRHKVSAIR